VLKEGFQKMKAGFVNDEQNDNEASGNLGKRSHA
jgi:hypothetical protein